jgi:hypothetical protein
MVLVFPVLRFWAERLINPQMLLRPLENLPVFLGVPVRPFLDLQLRLNLPRSPQHLIHALMPLPEAFRRWMLAP